MTAGDLERLRAIAARFRLALETGRADDHPPCLGVLRDFPRSCCHIASRLLARHLRESDFADVRGLGGTLDGRGPRHNWVEVGPVIVDLTADQFAALDPRPAPVIVTADRAFHDRFRPAEPVSYEASWHDLGWSPEFPQAYDLVYGRLVPRLG